MNNVIDKVNGIYKVLEIAIKNNNMYINCLTSDKDDANLLRHAYIKIPAFRVNDESINLDIEKMNEDDILILKEINKDIEKYNSFIVKTEADWNSIIEAVDSKDLDKLPKIELKERD